MSGVVGQFRNKRSVWTITTQAYRGAHFATFPEKLVEPCILAGTKKQDIVLDPFCGSGTVGVVAKRFGRRFVGLELNKEYVKLAKERIFGRRSNLWDGFLSNTKSRVDMQTVQ